MVEYAVEFAEMLVLRLSIEQAEQYARENQIGALSFVQIAESAIKSLERGESELPTETPDQTPFLLLASLVLDYLKRSS